MKPVNRYIIQVATCLSILLGFAKCDYPLPEEGSLPDLLPPAASFSYKQQGIKYLAVDFLNASISASDYLWDFGDGTTSTSVNPTHEFATVGTYTVTLTASDKLEQSSVMSAEVIIKKAFSPTILNPSFEDADRKMWAYGSASSSTFTASGSPTPADGISAAKLGNSGQFCRQAVTVEAKKKYTVSFFYVTKAGVTGKVTISKDAGSNTIGAEIVHKDLPTTANASAYFQEQITFESGTSTSIVIQLDYVDGELRYDHVTIIEEK
jgi:hypothetical protein